jgi:hypothetical protein
MCLVSARWGTNAALFEEVGAPIVPPSSSGAVTDIATQLVYLKHQTLQQQQPGPTTVSVIIAPTTLVSFLTKHHNVFLRFSEHRFTDMGISIEGWLAPHEFEFITDS